MMTIAAWLLLPNQFYKRFRSEDKRKGHSLISICPYLL